MRDHPFFLSPSMAAHGTPPPGAECAVTMDDIDESNYVEYQTMPSGAWHPAKFCEDITKTMLQTGFSRYLDDVGKSSVRSVGVQHPGPRAAGHLPCQRHTHAHVPCCTDKASRDCAAAVRRLVLKGPPIWLEDKHGYPIPDGDTHVSALWYMSSGVFPCDTRSRPASPPGPLEMRLGRVARRLGSTARTTHAPAYSEPIPRQARRCRRS